MPRRLADPTEILMRRAYALVPPLDEYPHAEIRAGLEHAGFALHDGLDADVLVTWTPWLGSFRASIADAFAASGRKVVVIENGWLNPIAGQPMFQIAMDGWNGGGRFAPSDDASRWDAWNVPLAPWTKRAGGYDLVVGQRGHPTDRRTAPPMWHETVDIGSPSVLRRGRNVVRPILQDILGADTVHVWSSNAASWAVCLGVPVVQHGPQLMVGDLASRPGEPLVTPERLPVLRRLAWAQWADTELAAGAPVIRLMEHGLL